MPESPIQEALSRVEIEQRLVQHARGIDRADEVLLRTAYHDSGTVDYGSMQGTAAEFASSIASMHKTMPMSLHRPSNVWVKIADDSALSESYVMAWVTLPTDGEPQPHLVGGRYLDQHTRRDQQWRMQHRRYVLDWIMQFTPPVDAETNPTFDLNAAVPRGGHHLSDPGNALLLAFASSASPSEEVTPMNDEQALDKVLSHQAIVELGCRVARGVDRGDPDLIMTAFHEDASVVTGVFNGDARTFSVEVGALLDNVSPRVAHTVTNNWIDIKGDHAVGESYVVAYQLTVGEAPEDVLTGGRYLDRYERRDGVWKISQRTFVMDWTTSSPSKDLMSLGMFEEMVKGERGTSDPIYAFWNAIA